MMIVLQLSDHVALKDPPGWNQGDSLKYQVYQPYNNMACVF